MSYCRFSSMNWRSDVYVYENTWGEWITHVAGRRRAIPPVPDLLLCRFSLWVYRWTDCAPKDGAFRRMTRKLRGRVFLAWVKITVLWHNYVHMPSLHAIPLRNIGLPHAGETLTADTPGDCADGLEYLRALGYVVPQFAIDALREESKLGRSS